MMKAVSTFALATLVLSFAACRQEPQQTDEVNPIAAPVVQHATDTATHPASPGGTAVVPDVAAGTTLIVVVTEGSVGVRSESIPPGTAMLTVENTGTETHNLFIEGEGISRAAGDPIPAGGTETVEVIFKSGTYTLYCPLLNHRELGEQTQITVGTGT